MNKNGQPKTNSAKPKTRVVHISIPISLFNRIRKTAAAEKRSINSKIGLLIEEAALGEAARDSRRQYEAQR